MPRSRPLSTGVPRRDVGVGIGEPRGLDVLTRALRRLRRVCGGRAVRRRRRYPVRECTGGTAVAPRCEAERHVAVKRQSSALWERSSRELRGVGVGIVAFSSESSSRRLISRIRTGPERLVIALHCVFRDMVRRKGGIGCERVHGYSTISCLVTERVRTLGVPVYRNPP